MEKIATGNLNIIRFVRKPITEYFIHAQKNATEHANELITELLDFIKNNNAQLFNLRIFTSDEVRQNILNNCQEKTNSCKCPVTWISQQPGRNDNAILIQAHAVAGANVLPIHLDKKLVGTSFEDASARYHQLSLVPQDTQQNNFDQTLELFNTMQDSLKTIGLDFSSAVRTWLFANNILAWYNDLNKARDTFFTTHDVFNKLVPASTGIGVGNPSNSAMVTELMAVEPLNGSVWINKVNSPMQCEALDYKSSFSRAVAVQNHDHRRLYVSGTASIAPQGETIHLNDTEKQIEETMLVIQALIQNDNMDWKNTMRAIAYFKDNRDFQLFDDYCKKTDIDIPHIKIEADICRDDLLFELELELLKKPE